MTEKETIHTSSSSSQPTPPAPRTKSAIQPTEADNLVEEPEIEKFLKKPDKERFQIICKILDFFIAGEDTNKQILFFLFLANYHNDMKTLTLYRGDSSAGKNFVVSNVLKLFPKTETFVFDSATGKALRYAEEQLLRVKTLFLKEMNLGDRDYIIDYLKSLFDEGERIHLETVKDPQEQRHIAIIHRQRRLGIVTTFSFENIQVDLLNRGWVLTADQTYDQTTNIIRHRMNIEKNLITWKIKKQQMDQLCFFIGQCIRALNFDYEVWISFIEKLENFFPKYGPLNIRRDKDKLIFLIKIITIWNQKNRRSLKIGNINYLFAEYLDLKMALEIGQKLFIDIILHIDETKRSILDYMTSELKTITTNMVKELSKSGKTTAEPENRGFYITEVFNYLREKYSISRRTVKRKMDDLYYEGYLLREKVGGSYKYFKQKDYDIIKALQLVNMKDEIDNLVDLKYNFFVDKTEEELEHMFDFEQKVKNNEDDEFVL